MTTNKDIDPELQAKCDLLGIKIDWDSSVKSGHCLIWRLGTRDSRPLCMIGEPPRRSWLIVYFTSSEEAFDGYINREKLGYDWDD